MQERNRNVIALMGNHEDMLIEYAETKKGAWIYNGCGETIDSYRGFENDLIDDIKWMKTLPVYFEDGYNIFVHAGIKSSIPMEKQEKLDLLWIREPFIYDGNVFGKRVIFGHTPTLFLTNNTLPVQTVAGNIGIDTGCVYNGKLTALILEDGEIKEFMQIENKKGDYYDWE